jgi:hypothetical protein
MAMNRFRIRKPQFATTGTVALFLDGGSPSDRVEVNGTVR